MTDVAVFVDGPLKGTDMAVDPRTREHGLLWRHVPGAMDLTGWSSGGLDFETAHYMFSRVRVRVPGGVVLVGSLAQPPEPEACFEVLCSDLAKKSALHRAGERVTLEWQQGRGWLPETGRKG